MRINKEENKFELDVEGETAVVRYELKDGVLTLFHIEVPENLRGKGIGHAFTKEVLEYARDNQWKVMPLCYFIKTYVDRHPEFQSFSLRHHLKPDM